MRSTLSTCEEPTTKAPSGAHGLLFERRVAVHFDCAKQRNQALPGSKAIVTLTTAEGVEHHGGPMAPEWRGEVIMDGLQEIVGGRSRRRLFAIGAEPQARDTSAPYLGVGAALDRRVASSHADRPRHLALGDLLANRIDANALAEVRRDEGAHPSRVTGCDLGWERRGRDQFGIGSEQSHDCDDVPRFPRPLEGQRREEHVRVLLAVCDEVVEKGGIAVQLGAGTADA